MDNNLDFNFELFVNSLTAEQLQKAIQTMEKRLFERKEKEFEEAKVKVLKVLRDFREKYPSCSIVFETQCNECGDWQHCDILEYLDVLDFE